MCFIKKYFFVEASQFFLKKRSTGQLATLVTVKICS
jgi:hypothetical protein